MNERRNTATQKLKNKKGFTLVEMLCAIVVLVLLSATMVVGIRLATSTYVKSVSYSEAQVLCSTLSSAMSDELRYATEIETDADGNLVSFASNTQGRFSMFSVNSDGVVLLGNANPNKLIPAASYTFGGRANIKSIVFNAEKNYFDVELEIKSADNVLASSSFSVKRVAAA